MDEEMEDTVEYTFTVVEIDLDYEFDAARYFDFSREESEAEARESELWFESARSYPPSPFVVNFVQREGNLLGNVNTSHKHKDADDMNRQDGDSDIELDLGASVKNVNKEDCDKVDGAISTNLESATPRSIQSQAPELPRGLAFYNPMKKGDFTKTKSIVKPSFQRTSTLMKPTASQLAKQIGLHPVGYIRLQKVVENNDKSPNNPFGVESQAAKRQKLEGGHLRKVGDIKHQTCFVHKTPKTDVTSDRNLVHAKLRLTIPREPDLETAQRAERIRPKTGSKAENVTSTVRKFKALPLNRKILEAPSLLLPRRTTPRLPEFQEFHLKTLERSMRHASRVSSSSMNSNCPDKVQRKPIANSTAHCVNRDSGRANFPDASKVQGCEEVRYFKALPLNKKEFNSHRPKLQHDPPIELFSKLSLTSEFQPIKRPLASCMPGKGSKENRPMFCREHNIKCILRENNPFSEMKQIHCGNDVGDH